MLLSLDEGRWLAWVQRCCTRGATAQANFYFRLKQQVGGERFWADSGAAAPGIDYTDYTVIEPLGS